MNFQTEIQKNKMFSVGLEILTKLEDKGFKAFFVGGCVRDLVIGIDPHDIDISTNATVKQIQNIFENTYLVGSAENFGVVVVVLDEYSFEVATFRKDIHKKIPNKVRRIIS
ncbi:MAG: Poly(A) polymerase I precursor [Candidatus Izimaplasma bacterium HR2]|nr:MAG: Poly(A) polymerase I precursor [Candidatus Izimaplasma bacterium HR2]